MQFADQKLTEITKKTCFTFLKTHKLLKQEHMNAELKIKRR